ncbi:MAG: FHA domain-containing protein [Armatimonadota bacterium]|nr:MAG: FHA domain-containing protein [Armatimonadota bacterium]
MPRCVRCGTENPDGRSLCSQCGDDLAAQAQIEDDDTLIMRLVTGETARPREQAARAYLWLLDPTGEQVERAAEISDDESVIIGRRADCTVVLPSNTVSRRHARIWRDGDDYLLADLGSTNGTLLNGEPAIGAERLNDRDEIAVGIYKLIFRKT